MGTNLHREIQRLSELPLARLRAEWHRWYPDRSIRDRLPRDLLVRMIASKLHEEQFGKPSCAIGTRLEQLSKQLSGSGILDLEREAQLKTGTSLIRGWNGQTYRVTALDEGFLWDGQRYSSLSEIARTITGVRWSGPRFFGLKQRTRAVPIRVSEQPHD